MNLNKWARFELALENYDLTCCIDNLELETYIIKHGNKIVDLFGDKEDSLTYIIKNYHILNIENNIEDSITNYNVHDISHSYWDYKDLPIWDKKFLTQYNSGSVFNSKFIHPCICKFCGTKESLKHCLMECDKLQSIELINYRNNLLIDIKKLLKINNIAFGWEDNPTFNKIYAISIRGNISIPLGDYIINNKYENTFQYIKKLIFDYVKKINMEDPTVYINKNKNKTNNKTIQDNRTKLRQILPKI
jgi:hypothetical protein